MDNITYDWVSTGLNSTHSLGLPIHAVFYPAKSMPVQAMTSQLFQENDVRNSVTGFPKVQMTTATAFTSPTKQVTTLQKGITLVKQHPPFINSCCLELMPSYIVALLSSGWPTPSASLALKLNWQVHNFMDLLSGSSDGSHWDFLGQT